MSKLLPAHRYCNEISIYKQNEYSTDTLHFLFDKGPPAIRPGNKDHVENLNAKKSQQMPHFLSKCAQKMARMGGTIVQEWLHDRWTANGSV